MSEELAEAAQAWLAKAQEDWAAVEILSQADNSPRDVVCFHCQQYVEKLLKSLLTLHNLEFPKTHALDELVALAMPFVPELSDLRDGAEALNEHAVQTRYPTDRAETDLARMNDMIAIARQFADVLLPELPSVS